jgi:uncharacterized protein (TIGR02646 family)
MRFVDPDDVESCLEEAWHKEADQALNYVKAQEEAARKEAQEAGKAQADIDRLGKLARTEAISENAAIWSRAGQRIRAVMHDKCWYCEVRDIRADMPVDHFRPKNRVAEEKGKHPGYWWLAFDWKNYRFSCTFCNSRRVSVGSSGGKQDHFPLVDPVHRARSPAANLEEEKPLLLDPCKPDDPPLLWFSDNGEVVARFKQADQPEANLRAAASIKLYHLNHPNAVNERKTLSIKIRNSVQRIVKLEGITNISEAVKDEIRELEKEIIRLVRPRARFCTAARCYLLAYRSLPWVDYILQQI